MRQLLLDITQAPEPSFANFVPGRNAEALAALRAAAEGRLAERVVYLWGEAGSGRSHLARAFAAARPGARLVEGARYDGDSPTSTETGGRGNGHPPAPRADPRGSGNSPRLWLIRRYAPNATHGAFGTEAALTAQP